MTLLFWSRTPNRLAQGARRGDEPPGQFVFPAGATRRRGTLSGRHALKPSAQYSRARRMCSLSASSMAMALAGGGIGNYRGRMCKVDPSLATLLGHGVLAAQCAARARSRYTSRALARTSRTRPCTFMSVSGHGYRQSSDRRAAQLPRCVAPWPPYFFDARSTEAIDTYAQK